MAFWVYKCNARSRPYQVAAGDWDDVFSLPSGQEWGPTEYVPEIRRAAPATPFWHTKPIATSWWEWPRSSNYASVASTGT